MTGIITKVLIVDDEEEFAEILARQLAASGFQVQTCSSAAVAIEKAQAESFDLVLTDVLMPGMSGLDMISELTRLGIMCPVIVMTAYGSVDVAIQAMSRGAYDYITKPFRNDEVVLTIRKLEERESLQRRVHTLEEKLRGEHVVGDLIGTSPRMQDVFTLVKKVSQFRSTVLIMGESGTGKELVARAVHDQSARASGPFVAVNCAAIPSHLLESELFGHVRGAFTDAYSDRKGVFEEADGGTLFLDEMGELPLNLQVKLLRALQDGEIRRVGSAKSVRVDVRLLAATTKNLEAEVKGGRFREDLFYRLNVVQIRLPPLRERLSDIPSLVHHFIEKTNRRLGTAIEGIDKDAMNALLAYDWPGNVRELENAIERAGVLAESAIITRQSLSEPISRSRRREAEADPEDLSLKKAARILEERYIRAALLKTGGNRTRAAHLLEISHRALLYKIRDYNIDIPHAS